MGISNSCRRDGIKCFQFTPSKVELWNIFVLTRQGKAKTTNSLEAWHNSLQNAMNTTDRKRPHFWRWLGKLKSECRLQESQLIFLQSGGVKKLNPSDKKLAKRRTRMANNYIRRDMLAYVNSHAFLTRLEQF